MVSLNSLKYCLVLFVLYMYMAPTVVINVALVPFHPHPSHSRCLFITWQLFCKPQNSTDLPPLWASFTIMLVTVTLVFLMLMLIAVFFVAQNFMLSTDTLSSFFHLTSVCGQPLRRSQSMNVTLTMEAVRIYATTLPMPTTVLALRDTVLIHVTARLALVRDI